MEDARAGTPETPGDAPPGAPGRRADGEVYTGSLISVRVETLPAPMGGVGQYEIVEHPDAVAVVALRPDPERPTGEPLVALVRQRRPAIGRDTWEIPSGLVRADERDDPRAAAARELHEETGWTAEHWEVLARHYPSPGFSTEAITLYLATGLTDNGRGPEDPTEIADMRWLPVSAALALAAGDAGDAGTPADGKTLLGLTLARDRILPAMTTTETTGDDAMPRDLTSMPMQRSAPFRSKERDATLSIDNMLLEEYNYASLTAYQAMEDRARIFNLYLLLVGVFVSGLGAIYQIGELKDASQPLAAGILFISGILGVTFFNQLIRLRQAYRNSLIAMNVIKEYYIGHFKAEMPDLEKAFYWRLRSIPAGERTGSVSFWISNTVALLASLSFGAGAFVAAQLGFQGAALPATLATLGLGGVPQWIPAAVVGLVVFVVAIAWHVAFFRKETSKKHERERIEVVANEREISG